MGEPALPDATIGRVCLRVADLDRTAAFYTSVVGLEAIERTDDRALLGAGGTVLLVLVSDPALPARADSQAGLFHVAFRLPDRAALGRALERIEADWSLTGASDHRVSEALYLRDPEDNGVELYRDRPREEWPTEGGRVRMDTLALDRGALRAAADGEVAPAGTTVGHVHLEVTDLAAARSFYADRLGIELRQRMDGALFLGAGGYHHHVGVNTWNRRSEPAAGRGLGWFELVVPDGALGPLSDRLGADLSEAVLDPDDIAVRIRPRSRRR